MKKFQVIADSTSDLEKKFRDEYDIDYCKMIFTMDNNDYEADLDWPVIKPDEYYQSMRNGKRSTTSIPNREEIETKFRKYLDKGLDVFYMGCSTKLSSSRNFAETISKDLMLEYPNRKIICYDSLRSCYGQGMMAIDCAKYANEGMDINEAYEIIKKNTLNYQTYCIVGSLEWLKKAGRVKASTAFFGNMIGIKPIICGDAKGNNYAFEKVVGRRKSLDRVIEIITERIENASEQTIYIEQANCKEDAEYIKEKIIELVKPKEINISDLGPIIGASTGPDTICVSFYGKEVTIYDGQE